jgi:uracil-DNA glycosylase family 4
MAFSSRSTPKISNPYATLPEPIQPIIKAWSKCQDCGLCNTRTNLVFYRGEAPCDVLFIGEAPGWDEDSCGLPFVGASGQRILDPMIALLAEEGITFTYGITNVVCCIPTEKSEVTGKVSVRVPSKIEADACRFRLLETIRIANPRLIVLLGKTAKKYVKIPAKHDHYKTTQVEIQHPAYIIRNGGKNSLAFKRNYLYLREAIESLKNAKEPESFSRSIQRAKDKLIKEANQATLET